MNPSPTRTNELRNDRQESILKAAEQLFADHGFHGVTLRQIADAARVPLALVGYYFGRKQELLRAIFAHRRHCHLDRIETIETARCHASRHDGLQRIVEAFVLPMLQLRRQAETRSYVRLLAREILLGSPAGDQALLEGFDPLMQRFADALHAARPEASSTDLAWVCQFLLGTLALHLRDERIERLSNGRLHAGDPGSSERLVRFLIGGLQQVLADPKAATTPPRLLR